MGTDTVHEERRRHARVTLVGSALITPMGAPERAQTAVLDNVNRLGAGLHAKESLGVNQAVTVVIAFLDQEGDEQQEKLSGRVAWTRPWQKDHLIGVVWEEAVSPEKHRWLHSYLSDILQETA